MTERERPMSEQELDQLLGTWLADGAHATPDRIAENALLEVATVPQDRNWLAAFQSSFASAPVAWVAGILALAIGIGLLVGTRLVGTPNPTPTPDPDALVLQSVQDAGYELLIPASWPEVDSGFADSRMWAGPDGSLMVSYGTSIFDGGEVTICAPPLPDYNTCGAIDYGYSVPVVPTDYTGPISQEGYLDRCDGACPVDYSETVLDGEPAGQDRLIITNLQLTYVSTFHNYRPIILYWSEPLATADLERVEAMRDSFAFLDGGTGVSPPAFVDPTELVLYSNPDDGYEMLMPRFWRESAAALANPDGDPYPGVQTFGDDGAGHGTPGLTISVGAVDGSVPANCRPTGLTDSTPLPDPICQALPATTVEQLGEELFSIPVEFEAAVPEGEEQGDLVLGGEAARYERPIITGNCLGCPGMLYNHYTIHGGRAVVLAFDYWDIEFERISPEYIDQMLASFRFLD